MAFLAPVVSAISGIAGIASVAKGLFGGKKEPKVQPPPAAPKPEDAIALADDQAKARRRRMVQTDITRGGALLPQGAVQQKSLLG